MKKIATTIITTIIIMSPGCAEEGFEDIILDAGESDGGEPAVSNDESTETFRGWTGYTSEEFPPVTCSNRYYAKGFECNGGYCDNIRMDCQYSGVSHGDSSWTSWFSEEGTDYRHCPWGEFVTGLMCSGSNCDNISLECTEAIGKGFSNCKWSSWYSEEDGPFHTPSGYYVKGMQCDGRFCDDKRYRYCRMVND